MAETPPKICVVGSSIMDLVSYVPRLPQPGETLHGTDFKMGYGGKGANQAVMAARLGAQVHMISMVGNDIFGRNTKKNFERNSVNTDFVFTTNEALTGMAPIAVDQAGTNSIIVVAGANAYLTTAQVDAAAHIIAQADVLVCQCEVPLSTSLHAMALARQAGVTTIFNPAPAPQNLPQQAYELSDIFCPNETETEILTGHKLTNLDVTEQTARKLLDKGCGKVLLTLGQRGSMIIDTYSTHLLDPETVDAVDTTGAGDCFLGSVAYFVAAGLSLPNAVRRANYIAAQSVLAQGTQTSFPLPNTLPKHITDTTPPKPPNKHLL